MPRLPCRTHSSGGQLAAITSHRSSAVRSLEDCTGWNSLLYSPVLNHLRFFVSCCALGKRADVYDMGDPQGSTRNLLVFHSSGLNCAFPLDAVREIVPMARLSSPPGLPSGLLGFLDLRGTAIPIIRLDRLFNLAEQKPALHTPMIILRGVPGPIGILADSVRGIVAAPSLSFLDIPENGTFQRCATAALQLDGELIHVLSPAALIDANEHRLLADYGAMSQARLRHMHECEGEERR